MATGEAYLMLDQMRAAGAVQDKNFNLINIDSNSYRQRYQEIQRHQQMQSSQNQRRFQEGD